MQAGAARQWDDQMCVRLALSLSRPIVHTLHILPNDYGLLSLTPFPTPAVFLSPDHMTSCNQPSPGCCRSRHSLSAIGRRADNEQVARVVL